MKIGQGKAIIMMATYNGENYLRDQLNSLRHQTYENWELIVSDDCSKDSTIKVLREYQKEDPRLIKILSNCRYHGPFANYFNVMYYVKTELREKDYDYFFYCDQDDIWDLNKLALQISKLNKYRGKPAFCYCDLKICDANCNDTGDKMSNHIRVPFVENPYNEFFKEQYVWGTAMCHNKELWNLIKIQNVDIVKNNVAHDSYISKYAALYADINYIPNTLVLYRRIGNNVTETPRSYNLKQALYKLLTKAPQIIKNASMTYWDSIYLLTNLSLKNKTSKDLLKCFNGNLIKKNKVISKYNIMKGENFWGKYSTFFILYTEIYKKTSFFKENKLGR